MIISYIVEFGKLINECVGKSIKFNNKQDRYRSEREIFYEYYVRCYKRFIFNFEIIPDRSFVYKQFTFSLYFYGIIVFKLSSQNRKVVNISKADSHYILSCKFRLITL